MSEEFSEVKADAAKDFLESEPESQQEMASNLDQPSLTQPVIDRIAKSVQVAHAINPNSWALSRTKDGNVTLLISAYFLLSCRPSGDVWLLVDTADLTEAESQLVQEFEQAPQLTSMNAITRILVPASRTEEVFTVLGAAHERAVANCARNVKTRAHYWQSHNPQLLTWLRNAYGSSESLPIPEYMQSHTTSSADNAGEGNSVNITAEWLVDQFARTGYQYTPEQVATFFTALQTKGFVVLSGISGTGKTKIAQGVANLMPTAVGQTSTPKYEDTGLIPISIKPYMLKYNRVILPIAYEAILPDMVPEVSNEVTIRFKGTTESGRLVKHNRSDSRIIVLYWRKSFSDSLRTMNLGDQLLLEVISDDDGISASEVVIRLPSEVQMKGDETPVANHTFLSVRPDWRDSTSLLGYYNPLNQRYESTEFLNFILQARANWKGDVQNRVAWFVILDEMNLAHVEYYFADLLSVLESGRDSEGLTREPIRISYPDRNEPDVADMPDQEIFLPPNLYFIGTVNSDETTHAFSPKVLDRAFTIELTEVDFSNYPPAITLYESADPTHSRELLRIFSRNGTFAIVNKQDVAKIADQIRPRLQSLNNLLRVDRFHFGYRVFDETAQFVANGLESGMFADFEVALDAALLMKVLPKFSGARSRLKRPLLSVLAWSLNPDSTDVLTTSTDFQSWYEGATGTEPGTFRFEKLGTRTLQMLTTLEREGFVSFG